MSHRRKRNWLDARAARSTSASGARSSSTRSPSSSAKPRRAVSIPVRAGHDATAGDSVRLPSDAARTSARRHGVERASRRRERADRHREGRVLSGADAERDGRFREHEPRAVVAASPSRFWAVGPQLAATLFDGGKRRAQVDLSEAAYDESVATYRQTVLTAFQQVEDQLVALRILEQESAGGSGGGEGRAGNARHRQRSNTRRGRRTTCRSLWCRPLRFKPSGRSSTS